MPDLVVRAAPSADIACYDATVAAVSVVTPIVLRRMLALEVDATTDLVVRASASADLSAFAANVSQQTAPSLFPILLGDLGALDVEAAGGPVVASEVIGFAVAAALGLSGAAGVTLGSLFAGAPGLALVGGLSVADLIAFGAATGLGFTAGASSGVAATMAGGAGLAVAGAATGAAGVSLAASAAVSLQAAVAASVAWILAASVALECVASSSSGVFSYVVVRCAAELLTAAGVVEGRFGGAVASGDRLEVIDAGE